MINYALGHAFNLKELFLNFNLKRLKMSSIDYKKFAGDTNREDICWRIFKECYKEVINDIIENNATFNLPVGKNKAWLSMSKIEGNEFLHARRCGKFKSIDFLKTFFTGYEIKFNMHNGTRLRTKNVYINRSLKEKIAQYTNEGKLYC